MANGAERTRDHPGWRKALVAALTFLVTLIILLFILRDDPTRVPLAERVEEDQVLTFEAEVERDLSPVTVRPTQRVRIRASRVVWRDDTGQPWLESPQVAFSVRVGAVLGDAVVIEDGVVQSPRLRLVQYGAGRWNYDVPLAPFLDPDRPRTEPGTEVRLRNILVRGGEVSIVRPDDVYRATNVDVELASGALTGPGVPEPRFHIRRATALVSLPGPTDDRFQRAFALSDARIRLPEGAIVFDVSRLSFGSSVVADLAGVWDPQLGGLELDARARLERLELADVPWLRVEAPEDAVASGLVRIEPLPGDRSAVLLTNLVIRSETSAAAGSLRLIFGPDVQLAVESVDLTLDPLALSLVEAFTGPLPYVGELRGTVRGTAGDIAVDLRARLATAPAADPFTIDLTGRAAFTEAGVELRQAVAQLHQVPLSALEPVAPGIPLRGPVSGTIRVDGPPGRVPLQLDVRLEAGGGVVTVAGSLDLRGPVPVYDLSGRLVGVQLHRVLQPAAPPVEVHAAFQLAGRGATLPTATATLRMDGSFAGWHAEPGDTLALRLQLAEGLLMAEEVQLTLGPVDLLASGNWRFSNGAGGAVEYALTVESLEPLGPFLPVDPEGRIRFARGSLTSAGTLSGSLESPRLAGTLRAMDVRFGEWAASYLEADYDVRLGPDLPYGFANVTGRDLRTPGGDFAAATARVNFTLPTFAVEFHGDRAGELGVVVIEAEGRIDPESRDVILRTVELDLDHERWRLVEPARAEWTVGDVVYLTGLRFEEVDGPGLLLVEGIVAPADMIDLRVEAAALPVGDLVTLVRPDLDARGRVWFHGLVRGPAGSPTVDLEVQLVDGTIRGVAIQHLRTRVEFADRMLTVVGEGGLDDASLFAMDAALPMEVVLGYPPFVELLADEPLRARVHTEHFDLAALDPAIPDLRDLEGRMSANLTVEGTALDPVLSGHAAIRDGAVTVRLLDQRYTGIEGELTLDGQTLRVERLTATSDGVAYLTGTIVLEDIASPVLDLQLDFQGFRAQGVRGRRDAALTGVVRIRGTPGIPVLSGEIEAADGTLDMARLQPPGRLSDDLIGVAERLDPMGPMQFDPLEPATTDIRISRLDLIAANDLWFQADEFRVQLGGRLTVQKPGPDVFIVGTLEGQRGTFNLRIGPATRRFDIVDARIQFFGNPDPDPALDITAARIIPGPNRTDFELRIRLTGTLSNPSVAFTTEDGTTIAEAEALNFLIFGRATATLADFPGAGFGTTQGLYDALAFYGAFDWLSAALAEQFGAGIDHFQVQVRSGTGDLGPEVFFVLGHEVFDDVFVMVTLPTADFEARWSVTAQWRIDRQWTLEAGYEPPDLVIGIPGRRLPFAVDRDQQLFVSIRRRWTY
jgi:hypothetical protein